MMNLTKKALSNTVVVGGEAYSIYTDFRQWMRFEIEVSKLKRGETMDISYLFKNDMPPYCNLTELFAFSRPESPLPRQVSHSNVAVLDYELDSDLIYAAFLGQYGIDLCDVELHWHKFLALLKGLNESTKLREVMGYRCYESASDSEKKDPYEEMRRAWEIEPVASEEELAELDDFNRTFGG